MSTFAVAIAKLEDAEVSIEVLDGHDWREAAIKHSDSPWTGLREADEPEEGEDDPEEVIVIPETISEAKDDAIEHDCAFDVVQIH